MSCRRVVAQSEEAVTSYPRIKKKKGRRKRKGRRKKKWLLKAVGTAINTSRVRTRDSRTYRVSFVLEEVCLLNQNF